MSGSGTTALLDAMRARGVIAAAAPPLPPGADRPWFIAVLQGLAGWFAGIFLLVFLGLVFKPDSTGSIVLLGIVLLGAAWALYFADRNAVFLDQLALALSMAGQIAIAWSAVKDTNSALPISATLLGLQLFVFVVMPNKTARTLAAFFACIAWVYTVGLLLMPGTAEEVLFDEAGRSGAALPDAWAVSAGWVSRWLPLAALAWFPMARESVWMATAFRQFLRPALTGVLLALSVGILAADPFVSVFMGGHAVGVPVNWTAVFPLLSIGLALFAAWCAFRLRSRGLLGFAILGALLQLSRFYYFYGTTLTRKAVIMLALGAALLAGGVALRRHVARPRSAA